MTVMEATALIRVKDETGPVFDRIAARLRAIINLEKMMSAGDRGRAFEAKVDAQASAVDRLMQAMQRVEQIDRTIARSNGVTRMTEGFDKAAAAARRLDTAMGATEKRAARLGHAASNFGMLAGPLMLEGMKKTVESAAEVEQVRNRILNVSNNPREVEFADSVAANASAKYPFSSKLKALEDYNELRSLAASSDPDHPIDREKMIRGVEMMAHMRAALASSGYSMSEEDAKALAQAIEGSGRAQDPKAMEKMAEAFVRAKQVFGNAINASMIRDFVQNAKAANFSSADDSFFFTTFARLAQGNASRLGNETAQTLSTLRGGHMTKAGAEWLARYGLINRNQIVDGKGGKFFIKGDIKDAEDLSADPTHWAQKTLQEAIVAHGDLSDAKITARIEALKAAELRTNPKAEIDEHALRERAEAGLISDALQKSGFRATVIDNLAHSIANAFQTQKDVEQMRSAKGLAAADTLKDNPVAALGELTHSLESFASTVGSPIMKDAAHMLDAISQGFVKATGVYDQFAKDHPDMAKGVSAMALIGGTAIGGHATYSLLEGMLGGFGLKGSAAALDHSAAALEAAAGRMAVGRGNVLATATDRKPSTNGLFGIGLGFTALEYAKSAVDTLLPQTPVGQAWDDLGFFEKLKKIGADFMADPFWGPLLHSHGPSNSTTATEPNGYDPAHRRPTPMGLLSEPVEDRLTRGNHGALDVIAAVNASLAGQATITVKVEPSADFRALVTGIVKQQMSAIHVDGVGTTGHTNPDIRGPR